MSMTAYRFCTPDKRFGLSIDASIIEKILRICREAGNAETGGILVGRYTESHEWAIVTDLSGPPSDSKRSHAFFSRGVKGLQNWLDQIWGLKRHYYLGDWHYHPFACPYASPLDAKQLREYSENGPLLCPEPVMLIIGGNPNGLWQAKAYVHPRDQDLYEMNRQ